MFANPHLKMHKPRAGNFPKPKTNQRKLQPQKTQKPTCAIDDTANNDSFPINRKSVLANIAATGEMNETKTRNVSVKIEGPNKKGHTPNRVRIDAIIGSRIGIHQIAQ